MSTPPSVRFGFIGAGAIAGWSASCVNSHADGQVVAATDTNTARLEQLCRDQSIPKAYATAGELFADPEIDAVYIAVPNKFHVPLAIEAMRAGKHVLLEKPFAMSHAEATQAAEVSNQTGKLLTIGMNQRFQPAAQKFRALVANGTFGEIYHAKACWLRRSGIPKIGTWFGSRELAGGGCLYDIGVHVLDLCLYVIDNFDPVSAYGSTYTKFGNRGLGEGTWGHSEKSEIPFEVEDFATGQIRFANGATVSLDVTWAANHPKNDLVEVQLFGSEAGGKVYAQEIYRSDDSARAWFTIDNPPTPEGTPVMTDRFHNFIDHLMGRQALCVTMQQALVVQKILDALAESARIGDSVRL